MRIASAGVLAVCAVFCATLCGTGASAATRVEELAKARPSVVVVRANRPDQDPLPGFSFPDDPSATTSPRRLRQVGTGFVIDGSGLVVTAAFNIEDATEIAIATADGRTLPATVVGSDAASSIAILRIAATDLLPLAFCAAPPQVGDDTLTIGNPYGVGLLAYHGMVAGTDIRIEGENFPYMALDMTTLKGMAGAPVLSVEGCVTGMSVAQFGGPGSTASDLGMAVPAARVQTISRELIASGHVARSWLGLQVVRTDSALVVQDIQKDGPADRAGVKAGDVIVGYDSHTMTSSDDLMAYLLDLPVGTDITLSLRRGHDEISAKITTIEAKPTSGG